MQFGTTSFVGVNASPGTEDCLKVRTSRRTPPGENLRLICRAQLWVWAPAGAKKGDKLPVHVYTQYVLTLRPCDTGVY